MPASCRTCVGEPRAPESTIMQIELKDGCVLLLVPSGVVTSSTLMPLMSASEMSAVTFVQMSTTLLYFSRGVIRPSWYWVSVSRTWRDGLGQDLRLVRRDDHVVRCRSRCRPRPPCGSPSCMRRVREQHGLLRTGDAVAAVDELTERLLRHRTVDEAERELVGDDAVEQHAADRGVDELALRLDDVRVVVARSRPAGGSRTRRSPPARRRA